MTKILRLGLSECTLLCIYWINTYIKENNRHLNIMKRNLIKWLYATSGFYDKKMKGTSFNQKLMTGNSGVYNDYMQKILNIIKDADNFEFCFHNIRNENYIEEFKKFINPKETVVIDKNIIFPFIRDKNVLFISPFASLYKSQIESGNCAKIHNDFPNVKNVTIYKNPYTFFNSGPQNNIFETVTEIISEISKLKNDFDCAIISCGAYSCLIADEIHKWGKDVCTVGGILQQIFGIFNNRMKQHNCNILNEIANKEYWIMNIPDEYKPNNYMKIEGGCYW